MTDTIPGTPQELIPVPREVVALLRLPISVEALGDLVPALRAAFNDQDLVIRTDLRTTDGWLPIAHPDAGAGGA